MAENRIITLTTDFGDEDYFVGAVKGAILSIHPDARIVDISHKVKSHDILDAAFLLAQSYHYFPPRTVHCCVVDPGVGSARRPIIAVSEKYFFVAPDNGVLSMVYDREPSFTVIHATARHFFLPRISQTFHGRDVFGPIAAWLSKGTDSKNFGEPITDYVKLTPPKPTRIEPNLLRGSIIKIDKFGNCITNIPAEDIPHFQPNHAGPLQVLVNQRKIEKVCRSYSEGLPGELFAIRGSSDFLELAINRASAAAALHAQRGDEVHVLLSLGV